MKPINKAIIAIMAGLALSAVTSQAQITLNFSSISGSSIQFNGSADTFQFNPAGSGYQWQIGSETGGTGSAVGLFGGVSNGPFSYGPITTVGSTEYATVSGPLGALSINDGLGVLPKDYLTGSVNWIQVETYFGVGGLNAALTVNISGLAYSGVNADLAAFVSGQNPAMDLSFQFSPSMDLNSLSSGSGPYVTSYTGSMSSGSVPEPSSVTFILMGMGALVCSWRLRQGKQA